MKPYAKFFGTKGKTIVFCIIGGILAGGIMGLIVGLVNGYAVDDFSLGAGIGLASGAVTGFALSCKKRNDIGSIKK
jgi:hypothetical protein